MFVKIKSVIASIVICFFFTVQIFSQTNVPAKAWTLPECIDYAIKNNLQVKQQEVNSGITGETYLQSKAQVLPSFNGSMGNNYNYGRYFDLGAGKVTSQLTFSQNLSLNSSLTLFSGLQNYNTILQNKMLFEASRLDVDKIKNDISLNVATAYLQILFSIENLQLAKNQAKLSEEQVGRMKTMVDLGASSKSALLDLEAQFASDEVTITSSQNNLNISILTLAQLMNLDSVGNFSVVVPEIKIPEASSLLSTPSQIYSTASGRMPEIKSAELKFRSAEKSIKVARGGMSPNLSLNSSIGSRFSQANKNQAGDVVSYKTQIDNNNYKTLGFQLSIPIFNGLQTKVAVAKSELNMKNAKLNLEMVEDQLKKIIQQAHADANAALLKYRATEKLLEARKEAFRYAQEKFNLGAISSFEYSDGKTKLAKAESDALQAKFDYIFKTKILDFYLGKPMVF